MEQWKKRTKVVSIWCHEHYLNTSGFSISVKAQKSRRKEFDPVCFQRHVQMAIGVMKYAALLCVANIISIDTYSGMSRLYTLKLVKLFINN